MKVPTYANFETLLSPHRLCRQFPFLSPLLMGYGLLSTKCKIIVLSNLTLRVLYKEWKYCERWEKEFISYLQSWSWMGMNEWREENLLIFDWRRPVIRSRLHSRRYFLFSSLSLSNDLFCPFQLFLSHHLLTFIRFSFLTVSFSHQWPFHPFIVTLTTFWALTDPFLNSSSSH